MTSKSETNSNSLGAEHRPNLVKIGIGLLLSSNYLAGCDSQEGKLDSPEELLPPNLCQTKGTICRIETDPNNLDIGELEVQFQTPKNYTWIVDSLSRFLLSKKIDFTKSQLKSNFTDLTTPKTSSNNLWEQEISTGSRKSLKYDVYNIPIDGQKVPVIMIKTKKNHQEPIELTKFLEIIDHPFSQHVPETEEEIANYPKKYQTTINQIASLYPAEPPYTHSLSPETIPTMDQAINTIRNSKDLGKDQLVIVNHQVIFDIFNDQGEVKGEVIGRVIIPEKEWKTIQEALKTPEEKFIEFITANPCLTVSTAIIFLVIAGKIAHGISRESKRQAGIQRGTDEAQADKRDRQAAERQTASEKAAKEESLKEFKRDQEFKERWKMTPFR